MNETAHQSLEPTKAVLTMEGLTIPDATTQSDWAEIHRNIILCKRSATKWLTQSRKWAAERWGIDYVADTEVQLELSLGLPMPEDRPTINPSDKSTALVTIEGISQSFTMWQRKVKPEMGAWSREQAKRAVDLLAPLAEQYADLKRMLEDTPATQSHED